MMKKRGTIIKEKERNQERREKSQEKLILSKSAEESDLLRDKIAILSTSPGASRERSALSKSMGETTSTKPLRSKAREMPEAHRLAKAGDIEGLLKLVHEQGRSTVLRTLDWRGQTVLHIAIDNNNRALTQRLIELYPDQIEADLNLRDNNGWSPIHVAAGTRVPPPPGVNFALTLLSYLSLVQHRAMRRCCCISCRIVDLMSLPCPLMDPLRFTTSSDPSLIHLVPSRRGLPIRPLTSSPPPYDNLL